MMGGSTNSSTLPTLLPAWGVSLDSKILADPIYAAPNAPPFIVQPSGDALPQKDDVVTKQLSSMIFYMPGGFTKTGGAGVSATSLVKSSNKAAFIDSAQTRVRARAARFDDEIGDVEDGSCFASAFAQGQGVASRVLRCEGDALSTNVAILVQGSRGQGLDRGQRDYEVAVAPRRSCAPRRFDGAEKLEP